MDGSEAVTKSSATRGWLDWVLWGFIGMAAVIAVLNGLRLSEVVTRHGPSALVFFLVLFAWGHGFRRYGLKSLLVFIAIVFVVGNFYENISIATGFPFGAYHYTEKLGAKFIFTPLIINIAYFQMIYLAWNFGGAIIGSFENGVRGRYVIVQPVLSTFITVMWDLSMDPGMSTVSRNWEWHEGGAYFGVPIQNFYGWYLCTFTMFLLFSLYMSRQGGEAAPDFVYTKRNWVQLTTAYGVLILNLVLLGLSSDDVGAQARDGFAWRAKDIRLSGGLIAVGTMLFIAVLVLSKTVLLGELGRREKQASGPRGG